MTVEEIIRETAEICRSFGATEVILFGSRAKGTASEDTVKRLLERG